MCDHSLDINNFCYNCGLEVIQHIPTHNVRYKKSTYDRRLLYFQKIYECYIGAQIFDPIIIPTLKTYIDKYYSGIVITQRHILSILKHYKLFKYYDSIYLIYCIITKTTFRSIDPIIGGVIHRMFADFLKIYLDLYPFNNFINIRFVLQKLLFHFNIYYSPPFYIFKSIHTKSKQEKIYNLVFSKLNLDCYIIR